MLAGKKTADELRQLLAGTEITIETKFDGERIQVHFNSDDMKFFSRYLGIVNVLSLETPMIIHIFMVQNWGQSSEKI